MRHGSLFSGIGGFDLAAQWMGWKNIFHCEWNQFGQKVLKYYWPKAISYEDITKTDFTIHRGQIDILTGGFPCQPYSTAGKRLGKEDDRHLWPEMLRAIREIQPRFVVGENVSGLVNWNGGMVFNEVQADLEAEGYEVTPFLLPACAVNAPHRRDRVWFVAHAMCSRHGRITEKTRSNNDEKREVCQNLRQHGDRVWSETERCCEITSDTESKWSRQLTQEDRGGKDRRFDNDGKVWSTSNSPSDRREWEREGIETQKRLQQRSESAWIMEGRLKGLCSEWPTPDTDNQGLQGSQDIGSFGGKRKNGNEQFARCIPSNWQDFQTQSPVCNGNDGLSSRLDGITFPKWRNESIKAGGNAIVPQVALQIFKAIQKFNDL